jgi:hypothetical protein
MAYLLGGVRLKPSDFANAPGLTVRVVLAG